jgi:hypothetical protein
VASTSTAGVTEGDPPTPPPAETAVAARRHRRGRRVVVLVLLLAAWVALVAWSLWSARGHLTEAEQILPAAQAAVTDTDLELAGDLLHEAHDHLAAAERSLGNPLVVPLRWTPVLGADLRTSTVVAEQGRAVTAAGLDVFATIDELPGGPEAFGPSDGAFPVDALERMAAPLRRTADTLAGALERLEEAPASGRVTQVAEGRARFLELLVPLADQAETGAQLAEHLPAYLGADRPRTYLFGASTPAELAGTGGFVGSLATVTLDQGYPSFGTFRAATDLPVLPRDELPAPVPEDEARWFRYGGTGAWSGLNRTPHFPAAAAAMQQLWVTVGGADVDGMIVADPFALQARLEIAGPAEVPGHGTLDAGSVVAYVANEAYAEFDSPDERKEVLGAVAAITFERFLEHGAEASPIAALERLGSLLAGGHLLLHAVDPDLQGMLSRLGATGELVDPEGDLVNVVLNNGSASKVDYYAERRLEHEVTLLADGGARSELTVTLTNDAPVDGVAKYVIGPNNPTLDAGDALTNVSVYLATGAEFEHVPPATADLPAFLEAELGHPVHDGWVRLASGETTERRYGWVTRDAWRLDGGEVAYELYFQIQTVIRPTVVDLRVRIPEGLEPVSLPDGAEVVDGVVRWSGQSRGEDVRLPLRFRVVAEE